MTDSRPVLTVHFRDPENHCALGRAAEALGISVEELAERAIEHELAMIGVGLNENLRRTVDLLGSYRGGGSDEDVEAFAHGDVTYKDPLSGCTASERHDSLGIGAVFTDPVER